MIKFCQNCGAAIKNHYNHCGQCGTRILRKHEEKPKSKVFNIKTAFVSNQVIFDSKYFKIKTIHLLFIVIALLFSITIFLLVDIDNDGLNTYYELQKDLNFYSNDTDMDGLIDGDEVALYQTDPKNIDSDGDGLTDWQEIKIYHSSPIDIDSDLDLVSDYDEIMVHLTSPVQKDTDGDGLNDYSELVIGTSPLIKDSDSDGTDDGVDDNPTIHDWKLIDSDNDGLTDYEEVFEKETNRFDSDTDGDGIIDGQDNQPLLGDIIMNPTDDTYVSSYSSTIEKNFGSSEHLMVSNNDAIFLLFDTETISDDAQIKSATLELYSHYHYESSKIYVYKTYNSNWDESTITYANSPAIIPKSEDWEYIDGEDAWYSWNITPYVKQDYKNGKMTFALVGDNKKTIGFVSKDWSSYKPLIRIKFY